MQAFILAAGQGKRMLPLTQTTPKPLLAVGGKPLIVWHIERLIAQGFMRIVVNVAHLASVFHRFFANNAFSVPIVLSDESALGFSGALETAGGVAFALKNGLLENRPFALINGDVWVDDLPNFAQILPMITVDTDANTCNNKGENLAFLWLVDNPVHNLVGDFGLRAGRVLADLPNGAQNLTFSGMSALSPKLFANLVPNSPHPAALAPLLRQAAMCGQVSGAKLPCSWVDVGTPERLRTLDDALRARLASNE